MLSWAAPGPAPSSAPPRLAEGAVPEQAPPRASRARPMGGAASGGRAGPRERSERRGGRLGSAGDRQVERSLAGH